MFSTLSSDLRGLNSFIARRRKGCYEKDLTYAWTIIISYENCKCSRRVLVLIGHLSCHCRRRRRLYVFRKDFTQFRRIGTINRGTPIIVLTQTISALGKLFIRRTLRVILIDSLTRRLRNCLVVIENSIYNIRSKDRFVLEKNTLIVLHFDRGTRLPGLSVRIARGQFGTTLGRTMMIIVGLLALEELYSMRNPTYMGRIFALNMWNSIGRRVLLLETTNNGGNFYVYTRR